MADLLDIQEKLQDTNAAIAMLEREVASSGPSLPSTKLSLDSLQKRQRQLQAEFDAIAADIGVDICSYRMIPDGARASLASVASSLGDFQAMFSLFYDAVQNGPKLTSQIRPEVAVISTLDFGYTFPGSLGIVFTLKNEQNLFERQFDQTVDAIFRVMRANSTEAILGDARKLGPAPIRLILKWANDQIRFGLSTDIEWKRGGQVHHKLLIQPPELRVLRETIEKTSDETVDEFTIVGELLAADTTRKTFRMTTEQGIEIHGSFKDAIGPDHAVKLPRRHRARIRKTRREAVATGQEQVDYFLLDINEV
jgi:hypothetical protein